MGVTDRERWGTDNEVKQVNLEKFVSKFASCHNLLWQFGTDFI